MKTMSTSHTRPICLAAWLVFASGCAAAPPDEVADEDVARTEQAYTSAAYLIRSGATGLCLDGYNGGGNIHPYMYNCNAANLYQRWRQIDGRICNDGTGKCLDAYVPVPGGNPYTFTPIPGNPYQLWTLLYSSGPFNAQPEYLVSKVNNACLNGKVGLGQRPYLQPTPCYWSNGAARWEFETVAK